ncbi:MAG: gamma-glutamylcyclotransferase family protein [Trueperaceae bacterium]
MGLKNYPAVVPGDGMVHGYVFTYEDIDAALVLLDKLEAIHDNPPEYTRQEVLVQLMNQKV